MAKIGASGAQEGNRRGPRPGSEGMTQSLRFTIANLVDNSAGSGLCGSVNIESGKFEFSSLRSWYSCEDCAGQLGFTRDCPACGRGLGNNVSFLAGRGDGVYSSVVFYGQADEQVLATALVFDEDNSFAESTLTAIHSGLDDIDPVADLLVPNLGDYLDLPGTVVGEIDCSEGSLVASDAELRIFEDAMVVVPWSAGHQYTVAVYWEPVIDSLGTALALGGDRDALTGGFEESLRPRVAVAVDSRYASEILGVDKELAENHDWARQHSAWESMPVASNLLESNGPAVALNNGLLWLKYLEMSGMPDVNEDSAVYIVEALGWFIQAAAESDDVAVGKIQKLHTRYGDRILNPDFLEIVVTTRGFALTDELNQFVRDICGPAPSFCSQCGSKRVDNARFCAECGGQY